jgi:hypothetical protein
MPSLQRSKKSKSSSSASTKDTYPVAHIVTPAHRLAEAKRGLPVQALCGALVTGDPKPSAGLCTPCSIAQFEVDDKVADERAQTRYDAGREAGKVEGRRDAETAKSRAEQERLAAERKELEKPRFEDHGRTMTFTFDDGSTATMRKNRIGSVRLAPADNGGLAVLVDGIVLIAHADATLVRAHHANVHEAIFGEA